MIHGVHITFFLSFKYIWQRITIKLVLASNFASKKLHYILVGLHRILDSCTVRIFTFNLITRQIYTFLHLYFSLEDYLQNNEPMY